MFSFSSDVIVKMRKPVIFAIIRRDGPFCLDIINIGGIILFLSYEKHNAVYEIIDRLLQFTDDKRKLEA